MTGPIPISEARLLRVEAVMGTGALRIFLQNLIHPQFSRSEVKSVAFDYNDCYIHCGSISALQFDRLEM